jgi:hypothetical protein
MSIASATDDICVDGLIGRRRENPPVFVDFRSACVARVLLYDKPAMLSRICSGWLVLLILLPFSAPFSTCDLTLFLGGRLGATHPVNRTGCDHARAAAQPLGASRSVARVAR